MSEQEVDTTQTEPQDLSVKRPRTEGPEEDNGAADDQQMSSTVEPPIETNDVCDSTTANQTTGKTAVSDAVIRYITNLYERKVFWDQVIDQSKSTEVLETLKKSLTFKDIDTEEVIKNKGKRQVLVNCDTDLKHLLTKLKFVAELLEGMADKTKAQINSYQMKDFDKD